MNDAANTPGAPVLELKSVVRRFKQGGVTLEILRGANLTLYAGETVALLGPSGSGKSTLLQIAGLLESPDAGEVKIENRAAEKLGDAERTRLRLSTLGFVYQFHHLLPEFSALENIVLPQLMAGKRKPEAKIRALELLERFGLSARASHRPAKLSGGEQQRIAVARAIANHPKILLADEPTGNLDEKTADSMFNELLELVRHEGLAALIATHNQKLAAQMDRIVYLHDGELISNPT
jgi:lipoprotein-releasing system ATP-binding protein